jgi:hypothetical protein
MGTGTQHLPEELIVAVLNRVGQSARIVDDFRLARIFDNASKRDVPAFAQFRCHRQYHFSRLLSDTLQILDHAGSITRENAAQKYFRVSPHTAGPFGRARYEALEPKEKQLVDEIAQHIVEAYGPSSDARPQARVGKQD